MIRGAVTGPGGTDSPGRKAACEIRTVPARCRYLSAAQRLDDAMSLIAWHAGDDEV